MYSFRYNARVFFSMCNYFTWTSVLIEIIGRDTWNLHLNVLLFSAVSCTTDDDCTKISGKFCVTDYCQKSECTATGQCVHGQVCSKYFNYTCVCE